MNILGIALLLLQVQLASAGGIVTKPGGSEPLPKATVLLSPVTPGLLRSTVTEEDGRFTLRDIEPGDYRLTVQSERYGHSAYGQRKPGGPGSILSVTPGQQLNDLRISMIPTGAIAGRITGRNGEPLVNAVVQAFKYGYQEGRKVLISAQATRTDDRGEYRLFWLPAGQYYVAAATGSTSAQQAPALPMRPGAAVPASNPAAGALELEMAVLLRSEGFPSGNTRLRILEDGTTQEEAWATVYYPSTTEARFASALDVGPGTTRSGVDIVIGPARIQSVRGRVVGLAPGSIPTVTLIPQDPSALRSQIAGKGASTIDGSFSFTGVFPGDYFVVARDSRLGGTGSALAIHVGDGDVENLAVNLGQPATVTGRVLVEGIAADSGSPNPGPGIMVSVRPTGLPPSLAPVSAPPDPRTGAFVLMNLAAGDYQIQVAAGGPSGPSGTRPLYVKSARLGQTDITEGLRVAANTADRIEIVLTPDPASVGGVAIGSRGGPAANTTVVLVPNVARKRFDLYRSVVTGADGRFRFQNLPPGDYKLFAWDDVETGAWQDPEFIRAFESKGVPVRLAGKSNEDVQLNVIYNP